MTGVVKLVGRNETQGFSNPGELWGIIGPVGAMRFERTDGRQST